MTHTPFPHAGTIYNAHLHRGTLLDPNGGRIEVYRGGDFLGCALFRAGKLYHLGNKLADMSETLQGVWDWDSAAEPPNEDTTG